MTIAATPVGDCTKRNLNFDHHTRSKRRMQIILPDLIDVVCDCEPIVIGKMQHPCVSRERLLSHTHGRVSTRMRRRCWWVLRFHPDAGISYPVIGEAFRRDHTTVITGIKTYGYLLERHDAAPEIIALQAICDGLHARGFSKFDVGALL